MELQSLRQEAEELRKKIKVMAGECMNEWIFLSGKLGLVLH